MPGPCQIHREDPCRHPDRVDLPLAPLAAVENWKASFVGTSMMFIWGFGGYAASSAPSGKVQGAFAREIHRHKSTPKPKDPQRA